MKLFAALWPRIKLWYARLGSKCVICGANDADNGVCSRKECRDEASEMQTFTF